MDRFPPSSPPPGNGDDSMLLEQLLSGAFDGDDSHEDGLLFDLVQQVGTSPSHIHGGGGASDLRPHAGTASPVLNGDGGGDAMHESDWPSSNHFFPREMQPPPVDMPDPHALPEATKMAAPAARPCLLVRAHSDMEPLFDGSKPPPTAITALDGPTSAGERQMAWARCVLRSDGLLVDSGEDLSLLPPPFITSVRLNRPFLEDGTGSLFWYKTWRIPELSITAKDTGDPGSGRPHTVVLRVVASPVDQAGTRATEVPMRGMTNWKDIDNGRASFAGTMFDSTSFRNAHSLFHLLVEVLPPGESPPKLADIIADLSSSKAKGPCTREFWLSRGVKVLSKRKKGDLLDKQQMEGRHSRPDTSMDADFDDENAADSSSGVPTPRIRGSGCPTPRMRALSDGALRSNSPSRLAPHIARALSTADAEEAAASEHAEGAPNTGPVSVSAGAAAAMGLPTTETSASASAAVIAYPRGVGGGGAAHSGSGAAEHRAFARVLSLPPVTVGWPAQTAPAPQSAPASSFRLPLKLNPEGAKGHMSPLVRAGLAPAPALSSGVKGLVCPAGEVADRLATAHYTAGAPWLGLTFCHVAVDQLSRAGPYELARVHAKAVADGNPSVARTSPPTPLKLTWISRNLDEGMGASLAESVLGSQEWASRLFESSGAHAVYAAMRHVGRSVQTAMDAERLPRVVVPCGELRLRSTLPGAWAGQIVDGCIYYNPLSRRLTVHLHVRSRATAASADGSFRALCDSMSDCLATVDRSGFVTFCSAACTTLFGHEAWEMLGGASGESLHPVDQMIVRQHFQRTNGIAILPHALAECTGLPPAHGVPGGPSHRPGSLRVRGVFRHMTADSYRWMDLVVTFRRGRDGVALDISVQARPSIINRRLYWKPKGSTAEVVYLDDPGTKSTQQSASGSPEHTFTSQ